MIFYKLYLAIDPYLISFFKFFKAPILNFYFGIFILVMISIIIGDFTSFLIYKLNRNYFKELSNELTQYHSCSIWAILFKNKEAFKLTNNLANESFGKFFFANITLSISSLWIIPFSLGWLNLRFSDIELNLPLFNLKINYLGIFILIYILAKILLAQFKKVTVSLKKEKNSIEKQEKMLLWSDLTYKKKY